ncbi:unnamed protein product [Amoebophrya sp. A25]|nr:unnamed protein product [Amoebophrya sp. A25]|eukprot:GSA25T00018080001.1
MEEDSDFEAGGAASDATNEANTRKRRKRQPAAPLSLDAKMQKILKDPKRPLLGKSACGGIVWLATMKAPSSMRTKVGAFGQELPSKMAGCICCAKFAPGVAGWATFGINAEGLTVKAVAQHAATHMHGQAAEAYKKALRSVSVEGATGGSSASSQIDRSVGASSGQGSSQHHRASPSSTDVESSAPKVSASVPSTNNFHALAAGFYNNKSLNAIAKTENRQPLVGLTTVQTDFSRWTLSNIAVAMSVAYQKETAECLSLAGEVSLSADRRQRRVLLCVRVGLTNRNGIESVSRFLGSALAHDTNAFSLRECVTRIVSSFEEASGSGTEWREKVVSVTSDGGPDEVVAWQVLREIFPRLRCWLWCVAHAFRVGSEWGLRSRAGGPAEFLGVWEMMQHFETILKKVETGEKMAATFRDAFPQNEKVSLSFAKHRWNSLSAPARLVFKEHGTKKTLPALFGLLVAVADASRLPGYADWGKKIAEKAGPRMLFVWSLYADYSTLAEASTRVADSDAFCLSTALRMATSFELQLGRFKDSPQSLTLTQNVWRFLSRCRTPLIVAPSRDSNTPQGSSAGEMWHTGDPQQLRSEYSAALRGFLPIVTEGVWRVRQIFEGDLIQAASCFDLEQYVGRLRAEAPREKFKKLEEICCHGLSESGVAVFSVVFPIALSSYKKRPLGDAEKRTPMWWWWVCAAKSFKQDNREWASTTETKTQRRSFLRVLRFFLSLTTTTCNIERLFSRLKAAGATGLSTADNYLQVWSFGDPNGQDTKPLYAPWIQRAREEYATLFGERVNKSRIMAPAFDFTAKRRRADYGAKRSKVGASESDTSVAAALASSSSAAASSFPENLSSELNTALRVPNAFRTLRNAGSHAKGQAAPRPKPSFKKQVYKIRGGKVLSYEKLESYANDLPSLVDLVARCEAISVKGLSIGHSSVVWFFGKIMGRAFVEAVEPQAGTAQGESGNLERRLLYFREKQENKMQNPRGVICRDSDVADALRLLPSCFRDSWTIKVSDAHDPEPYGVRPTLILRKRPGNKDPELPTRWQQYPRRVWFVEQSLLAHYD